jgi:hypothetical protein
MSEAPKSEPPRKAPEAKRHGWMEWTQIASNVAVILSALVVVPMYLVQRRDTNQLERQKLAAEMFQRKYDERVMTAYTKVSDVFDTRNRDFDIFAGGQESAKKAVAERIVAEAGLGEIKIVVDYYNDLLVCMDAKLCDENLATSLIGQDIKNFYCKARSAGLPQLRERYAYKAYGERLERFKPQCDAAREPAATQSAQP